MRIIQTLQRLWSAVSQPGTGGLVQPGDWRCIYPDGARTYWMSYGDAVNCRRVFGGERLQWRYDADVESCCEYCGRIIEVRDRLECPQCGRPGCCTESGGCMPGGRGCICPQCETPEDRDHE